MDQKEILGELNCDDCDKSYCFLQLLFKHLHVNQRDLIQIKCIEKFKYEESCREGFDIGETKAALIWAERGFAKAYAEVYNEDKTFKQIYSEVINYVSGSSQV